VRADEGHGGEIGGGDVVVTGPEIDAARGQRALGRDVVHDAEMTPPEHDGFGGPSVLGQPPRRRALRCQLVQSHQLSEKPQLDDAIADGLADLDHLGGELGRGRVHDAVPLDEGDPAHPPRVAPRRVEAHAR
jgi:hypothetical protein